MHPRIPAVAMLLVCALAAPPARAAHVTIDTGGCRAMHELLVAMKSGAPRDSATAALHRILATPAYVTMFHHYNRSWRPSHLPESVFERMILSLQYQDAYRIGENERADTMRTRWSNAYADLPRYERHLRQLEAAPLSRLLEQGIAYAQGWLPRGWTIPDFELIVQPQGGSGAFSIDRAQGFDFLQLVRTPDDSLDVRWLVGTIAHESHHLGMRGAETPAGATADTVAFRLLSLCVAEGVATEFVSGPPDGRVPRVPGVPFAVFSPAVADAWRDRVEEEPAIFAHMVELLDRATKGTLSQEELDREMREYWFSGTIGRGYVLGAEVFGAIYHAFGKGAVFAAIQDPRRMFQLYNRALDRKPKLLGECVRMPETSVAQALAVGRGK